MTEEKMPLKQKGSSKINSTVSPWAQRGEEDVAYQRQAQVSWWTLLGGIAVAALLTQVDALVAAIQSGKWYYLLYFLATSLVIINAWVQTAWGALVLRWPISVPTSLIIFIGGVSLSFAALNITRPGIWFIALSVVLIFSQLIQYTFQKRGAWVAIPAESIKHVRIGIIVYWLLVAFTVFAGIFLLLSKKSLAEMILGCVALILSGLALLWQHLGMEDEKKRMKVA